MGEVFQPYRVGYDLRYREKKIEVKASGYLQSWRQSGLSKISFDIMPKKALNETQNVNAEKAERNADCYIFCLYAETDRERADILDIDAWEFYVITTARLNALRPNQDSISLGPLQKLVAPQKYDQLRAAVDQALFGGL